MNIIDAGLQFNSGHGVRNGAPQGIVLHHAAATSASVETIHRVHKVSNGWIGIGYHFYVRKDGSVYRGRPEEWIGAHATGYNSMIGICAEGNFQEDEMPDAQKKSIIELVAYLLDKYGDLKIYGHRELGNTACPGKNYPFDEIVKAAKNGSAGEVTESKSPTNSTTSKEESTVNIELNVLKKGSTGNQVRALQRMLHAMGYSLGTKNPVDGDFGTKTDAAVRAYQKLHNLTIDGIVGAKTWAKLLKG